MEQQIKNYTAALQAILTKHLNILPKDGNKLKDVEKYNCLSAFNKDFYPKMDEEGQKVINQFINDSNDFRKEIFFDLSDIGIDIRKKYLEELSIS